MEISGMNLKRIIAILIISASLPAILAVYTTKILAKSVQSSIPEMTLVTSSRDIEAAATDLINNLQKARDTALKEKTGYLFSMFDTGYDIGKDVEHNENFHAVTHIIFNNNIEWNNKKRFTVIYFSPDGYCRQIPNNFTISFQDRENNISKSITNDNCTFHIKDAFEHNA
jgi:hypothetical protein